MGWRRTTFVLVGLLRAHPVDGWAAGSLTGLKAQPTVPAAAPLIMSLVSDLHEETVTQLSRVVDGMHRVAEDKRRVDELVLLFEYGGIVKCGEHRFAGQVCIIHP